VQDLDTKSTEIYALTLGEFVEGGEEDGQEIHVSMASPLGKALLGSKKGETVQLALPMGKRRLKIMQVLTVHDLAAGHTPPS
jgi:transcription elongation GreA/GreB family factor